MGSGQWHCPGKEEEGAGEGEAGNHIALKKKKREQERERRAIKLPWNGRKGAPSGGGGIVWGMGERKNVKSWRKNLQISKIFCIFAIARQKHEGRAK